MRLLYLAITLLVLPINSVSVKRHQAASKFLAQNQWETDQSNSEGGNNSFIKVPLTKVPDRSQVKAGRLTPKVMSEVKSFQSNDGLRQAQVNLTNNWNFDYIGTFYVGNPPQALRGCFDTGSANAWILSSECKTQRCKEAQNLFFDSQKSSTFEPTIYKEEIQFGSGKLAGYFAYDDFRVGQLGAPSEIHIKKQTLGLITEEEVLDPDYDAIIGLAYPKMASLGLPIFDSMIEQGLLSRNIFAFYMAMTERDQSELVFGGYDEDKFIGEITWHPVVDKLFWSIKLDGIKYNGKNTGICSDRDCMITPDSGTSLITMPTWAQNEIVKILPYVENCENKYGFGVITFIINGQDYNIPSHHFMERYVNVFEYGDSVCSTSIQPLDIYQDGQENLFIVGDAFMQIYYSIFDRDQDRVGLAKAKEAKMEQTLSQMDWQQIHGGQFNQTHAQQYN